MGMQAMRVPKARVMCLHTCTKLILEFCVSSWKTQARWTHTLPLTVAASSSESLFKGTSHLLWEAASLRVAEQLPVDSLLLVHADTTSAGSLHRSIPWSQLSLKLL